MRAALSFSAIGIAVVAAFAQGPTPTSTSACVSCHADVWETYRRTGMARSFSRPNPSSRVEDYVHNTYYHKASDTYFEMIERAGHFFKRQYQSDFDGKQANAYEREIEYILGSGSHVRAYLSRGANNTLVQ